MDKLLKEVLMIDELSIVETDKVNHTVEMDMLKLVVEVECFGKCVDEFDKVTVLFGENAATQKGWSYVHAQSYFIWHVFMLFKVSMKLINIGSMQVFDQLSISNKFTPLIRKCVQKLGINLKLIQWHLVDVHIIE
ncbi:hypothetical protein Tco_0002807 [Tanacetum coccineum]